MRYKCSEREWKLSSRNVPLPELRTGIYTRGGNMDVIKILQELRQEREQIEEAILTLERLAQGRGRRRGRPPAWLAAMKKRGRPPGSKNKTTAAKPAAA